MSRDGLFHDSAEYLYVITSADAEFSFCWCPSESVRVSADMVFAEVLLKLSFLQKPLLLVSSYSINSADSRSYSTEHVITFVDDDTLPFCVCQMFVTADAV